MIADILKELEEQCDLSFYELQLIKRHLVNYAIACQADSDILEEAEMMSGDIPDNVIYHDFKPRTVPNDAA